MKELRFIKKCHRLAVLIIALMLGVAAQAAVSFTVQAPRQVSAGNKFNVTFVLKNAEGSNFTAPEIAGATKIYGPALSTSYSSSWVNGKSSSSSSQEYTMIYKATHSGRLNVGAATVEVNGRTMRTSPFTIEVTGAGGASSQQRDEDRHSGGVRYNDPMTQSADKAVTGKDIFVRIEMSKPRVFEQQAVVCTIKLYTKYQVSQFMPTQQPSFDGFLIEEIPMQPSLNNVETVNGQQYMVAILKKCLLYPQKSGKLTITSGNYDVNVVQYEQYRTIFGTLQQPVEKSLKVQSNTATVNILPLPEPRPESFTGAVGKFTVETLLKPDQLKTYQAATYTYIIKGMGNIKYLKAPELKMPKEMDVYDPKSTADAKTVGTDMAGAVTIDYPFIPQFAGTFELPASEFTFFNPETEKYESIPIPGRKFTVAKGEGTPSNHYRIQNMDIRHIATGDLGLKRTPVFMVAGFAYWLWYIVPLLLLAAVLIYYRKQLKLRSDVRLMRNKRASRVAQRRLKQAQKFINAGNSDAFYAETLNSLWGYLSDKLTIPVSELSKDNIEAELEAYGVEQALRERTLALLDKCEYAQYAPELAGHDLQGVWDEAAGVIDSLESVKRKKTESAQ